MAAWNIFSFQSDRALADFLNGTVQAPVDITDGLLLDGLTLVINLGAGDLTVTFAPALGRAWTPAEIIAKIAAADPTLATVASIQKEPREAGLTARTHLKLLSTTGVTVDATGTSNTLFGFSAVVDTVGRHYASTEIIATHKNWNGHWEWSVITLV